MRVTGDIAPGRRATLSRCIGMVMVESFVRQSNSRLQAGKSPEKNPYWVALKSGYPGLENLPGG